MCTWHVVTIRCRMCCYHNNRKNNANFCATLVAHAVSQQGLLWQQELTATKTEFSVELLFYRDTRISQLEQSLAEREDCLLETRQQRSKYITQLSENTRKIAELETR